MLQLVCLGKGRHQLLCCGRVQSRTCEQRWDRRSRGLKQRASAQKGVREVRAGEGTAQREVWMHVQSWRQAVQTALLLHTSVVVES